MDPVRLNDDLATVTRIVAENINNGIDYIANEGGGSDYLELLLANSEIIEMLPDSGVVVYIYNNKRYRIAIREEAK